MKKYSIKFFILKNILLLLSILLLLLLCKLLLFQIIVVTFIFKCLTFFLKSYLLCCKIALDKAQILNATLNTVNTMSDISQLTCSRDVGRPMKT